MTETHAPLQVGDLIDITLRRVVIRAVHDRGTLAIQHSDLELQYVNPGAIDIQITRVGHLTVCVICTGADRRCAVCGGTGEAFP